MWVEFSFSFGENSFCNEDIKFAGDKFECIKRPNVTEHKNTDPQIPNPALAETVLKAAAAMASIQAMPAMPLIPIQDISTAELIKYLGTSELLFPRPICSSDAKMNRNKMNVSRP